MGFVDLGAGLRVRAFRIALGLAAAGCSGQEADGTAHNGGDAGNPFGNSMVDAAPGVDAEPRSLRELTLAPQDPELTVERGQAPDTIAFEVADSFGRDLTARYQLDKAGIGTIDDDGVFTPTGTQGGQVTVEAQVGNRVLRTTITVRLQWTQNGSDAQTSSEPSRGGRGGVGGEGEGPAVTDAEAQTFESEPQMDGDLQVLYPYDETVMPMGLLAPLLMWSEPTGGGADVVGVRIRIRGVHFDYTGMFGRPTALASDSPFVRHPIPQDVWEAATQTVAGGGLSVEITLAKADAHLGPMKVGLRIAAGTLKGTVYYQSYGTNLAKNYGGAIGGDGRFGGATLAIKPGAAEPELVAGGDGGAEQCRVCHSVSSDGSRMTVQHGDDYAQTSSYDLGNGYAESVYAGATRTLLAWPGLSPDGAYALGNSTPLGVNAEPVTALYDMDSGMAVASTGLQGLISQAAMPAFSHDGTKVAFNFYGGSGNAAIGEGDGRKLVAMDFDSTALDFSNPRLLYEGDAPAGWPTFTPGSNGVAFAVELRRNDWGEFFFTRYGAQHELWWTSLRTGRAHRLDRANGLDAQGSSYLPASDANHQTDEVLNYEPTIAPIASGGYAWMVFTSRRLYGNVATIDPFWSDPREHDLTQTPTTKKLWVAAIDLDVDTEELSIQAPDDPSHPAFYLPGQELLAGNTRGFWTVDPCKPNGERCETGVDCCSGFCQRDEDSGELTCGRKRDECSSEYDACESSAECCDESLVCINRVCTRIVVD